METLPSPLHKLLRRQPCESCVWTEEAKGLIQTDDDADDDAKRIYLDYLNRPIGNDRAVDMGGWKCSYCVLGSYALGGLAYYGVLFNLVLYLVQVCSQTNNAAANTVTNVFGTTLLCSVIGAFLGDTYMGRLWATLIFQIFAVLPYLSISLSGLIISKGSAIAAAETVHLVALYFMGVAGGLIIPNCLVLGADQLNLTEEKEKYFRLLTVSLSVGQFLAVTLVTYIDDLGMWVPGFWLCTVSSIGPIALFAVMVRWFRQYKATGNPFLRVTQVLVAAWKKRSLPLPNDDSLLYECHGSHKLQRHSSILSFLDKAAVLDMSSESNARRLCTVTQVEELKSLLRVIPVGIANTLVTCTTTQTSTLFVEQADLMNRQVTSWFSMPSASLNLFSIGSVILTGIVITAFGARLIGWCMGRVRRTHTTKATSLQLQGVALVCSTIAMVIAALVESHRLHVAQEGTLLSVFWLLPQTVLAGAGMCLAYSGGFDFFYNEVPDGMRTVSSSILCICQGAGSYLSSILVSLVTAITTQGGQAGWIASDLNEGHLDYYYWFLTSCLAFTLGVYLLYTYFYRYTQ